MYKKWKKKKCKLEVIYVYKTSGNSEKKKQTSERQQKCYHVFVFFPLFK